MNKLKPEDARNLAQALRADCASINEDNDKRGILSSRAAMAIADLLDAQAVMIKALEADREFLLGHVDQELCDCCAYSGFRTNGGEEKKIPCLGCYGQNWHISVACANNTGGNKC